VAARIVINNAADLGWCPHLRVKGFKEAAVEKRAIDRAWIDKFREQASHHNLATLAFFNFVTGARISEAVKLTPEDFDLDNKVARIAKTKNGDYRYFYLTDELVRELRLCQPRKATDGSLRMFKRRGRTRASAPTFLTSRVMKLGATRRRPRPSSGRVSTWWRPPQCSIGMTRRYYLIDILMPSVCQKRRRLYLANF
jgi:integrase